MYISGYDEVRVSIDIDSSVMVADEFRHNRCAVRGVFTVQNQGSARLDGAKQITGQLVLIIIVQGTIDVATLILVLETTVDNHDMVEAVAEFSIQKLDECALVDARQVVRLLLGDKVRKLKAGRTVDIAGRLKGCICRYLGLFLRNYIGRMLKHTQ
jgi:hypothetical protein